MHVFMGQMACEKKMEPKGEFSKFLLVKNTTTKRLQLHLQTRKQRQYNICVFQLGLGRLVLGPGV